MNSYQHNNYPIASAGGQSFPSTYMNPQGSYRRSSHLSGMTPDTLLRMIASEWKLIGAIIGVCVATAFVYCLFATRLYTATAVLEVSAYAPLIQSSQIEAAYQQKSTDRNFLKTQIAKITHLSVADEVLSHPEYGVQIREYLGEGPGLVSRILQWIGFSSGKDDSRGEHYRYPEGMLKGYLSLLEIDPVYDTSLVNISVSTSDPELSRKIVNAHSDGYIKYLRETRQNNLLKSLVFLQQQGDELKGKVAKAEEGLAKYAEENKLISITRDQNSVVSELNDLTRLLVEATGLRIRTETRLNEVKDTYADSTTLDDDSIRKLRISLKESQAEYADLNSKVTPLYPPMIQLKARIGRLKEDIIEQRRQAFRSLEAKYQAELNSEKKLIERIEVQREKVHDTSKRLVQYNILQREYDSLKDLYQNVLRQLKESQISSASGGTSVTINEYAALPASPSSPNTGVSLALALSGGLFLGVGIVLLRSLLDTTIKGSEEATAALGIPLIGLVPSFDDPLQNGQTRLLDHKTSGAGEAGDSIRSIASKEDWTRGVDLISRQEDLPLEGLDTVFSSPAESQIVRINSRQAAVAAESFRTLRTNILLSSADDTPRVLMATSPKKGEGKTTVMTNLAVTLAQAGYKTLIIDADIRQSEASKRFNLSRSERGLVDALAGGWPVDEVIRSTGMDRLCVMSSGSAAPNPTELLGSRKMKEMVRILSGKFDYVLIDAPPVLPVADSLLLSQLVDRVIVVVRDHHTEKHLAREALERLQQVQAPLLGVVLNDVDFRRRVRSYGDDYSSVYYMVAENSLSDPDQAVGA